MIFVLIHKYSLTNCFRMKQINVVSGLIYRKLHTVFLSQIELNL